MDADVTDPAVLRLATPVAPSDGPRLCAELADLAAAGADEVVCDVSGVREPQLAAVDALARLRLTARRAGCRLRLRHPTPQLRALLALTGLAGPLGLEDPAGTTPRR
ncbi:STAS domain-containing protein [Streptomyces sp. NPDC058372]|uniref:STAS domain-containing protein n=1 Tax=Streptomyces sp. NPDC058372 TaxID=3346464 RepID=UPI003650677F